jgi:hypothetical protein
MLYCRKCGAKLDEGANFCRKCGAPVEGAAVPPAPPARHVRRHHVFPVVAGVLIAVLVLAFFFAVIVFVPVNSVNFGQTESAAAVPGVNTINLNFDADVADVNIIPTPLSGQLVKLDINASGSMGLFGSQTHPVNVVFTNETSGNTLTVTSSVTRTGVWPFSYNLKVTCDIYVDHSAILNVTAKTSVGSITLDTDARAEPLVFQNLTLRSTTGSIRANLTGAVELRNDVSVSATTGSVQFIWNGVSVSRSLGVTLASTTGSITAEVTRSGALGGNVTVEAATTTGSVNWGMNISGDVGAKFTSQTTVGSILVDVQNFNGNKSPIASSNYPAATNFVVDSRTTTGSIHITAAYNSSTNVEQVRADVMRFLP